MTAEKAIEILSGFGIINRYCSEDAEALDMAIKALEQQPCEDCISRAEAINALDEHKYSNEFCEEHNIDWSVNLGMVHILLNELPSVTPTRPIGKWEYVQYDYNPNIGNWHCSECRFMFVMSGVPEYKYCPNCRARMIESEE